MKIKSSLIRSSYIGTYLKELINEKGLSITEVAEKIGSSRPTINNMLNGRTNGTDSMYTKIMKGIGLSSKEIENLFKEADQEEYKYKYGEAISSDCEDFDFEIALKKEFGKEMNQDTVDKIKNFINFVNQK